MDFEFSFDVFPDKQYNRERLTAEITAKLGYPPLQIRRGESGRVLISVPRNAVGLNVIIEDVLKKHASDLSYLPAVKQVRVDKIDARTQQIIAAGFHYGGLTFSLSANAQMKILATHSLKDDPLFTYPVRFSNIDDTALADINNANDLHNFFLAAASVYRPALESGTALKQRVRAATSLAEVNAVEDTR